MLGRTANGLTWMSRYIERAENISRLVETGLRMSLVRADRATSEWGAIVSAAGVEAGFTDRYGPERSARAVIDYLLRDQSNPSAALGAIRAARENARMVRTAITREVWEAVNDYWHDAQAALRAPVQPHELPDVLEQLRRDGALVRGALHGTMLRNDIFNFARIGTFLERADNTARILDVKYHVLLPDPAEVGGTLDMVQWEQLLRAVHINRAYVMVYGADYRAPSVAEFLILDPRMPRSLLFCTRKVHSNLRKLTKEYGNPSDVDDEAGAQVSMLDDSSVEDVIESGLHEFLTDFIERNAALATSIARTYRFVE